MDTYKPCDCNSLNIYQSKINLNKSSREKWDTFSFQHHFCIRLTVSENWMKGRKSVRIVTLCLNCQSCNLIYSAISSGLQNTCKEIWSFLLSLMIKESFLKHEFTDLINRHIYIISMKMLLRNDLFTAVVWCMKMCIENICLRIAFISIHYFVRFSYNL
jgi:hypothetical protein